MNRRTALRWGIAGFVVATMGFALAGTVLFFVFIPAVQAGWRP
jgi:hypothetical protein